MSALRYNITIEEGSQFELNLTWKDEDGNLVDLTGYEARMHIRETVDASTTLDEYTSTGGEITMGGANGTIDVLVGADVTVNYDWDEDAGVYDLEVYDPNDASDVTRLIEGKVKFTDEVTR